MKAILRSTRIAPKKANLVAEMVRGLAVEDALMLLGRTHKKAARLLEKLIASAAANAVHNEKQQRGSLMIKSIVVQQGAAYRRGVPMARGRVRPMRKFLSHIYVTLGIASSPTLPENQAQAAPRKGEKKPSQRSKNKVQGDSPSTKGKGRRRSSTSASPSSASRSRSPSPDTSS